MIMTHQHIMHNVYICMLSAVAKGEAIFGILRIYTVMGERSGLEVNTSLNTNIMTDLNFHIV